MESANVISGVHASGANLLRRPVAGEEDGKPVAEAPPSGAAQAGSQVVMGAGKTQESSLSADGKRPDKQHVADAVKNMNDFLQKMTRTLQFSMDEESGEMVVQIRDQETNEVIRQIPSELMLKLAEQMDKFKGLLFEETV